MTDDEKNAVNTWSAVVLWVTIYLATGDVTNLKVGLVFISGLYALDIALAFLAEAIEKAEKEGAA